MTELAAIREELHRIEIELRELEQHPHKLALSPARAWSVVRGMLATMHALITHMERANAESREGPNRDHGLPGVR